MSDAPGNPRDWPESRLRAECRWEAFRGPGPGGQKRNKTSSAVRVTHVPTGITGSAGELRSQAQNRARAFSRLRHRLALELRNPLAAETFESPEWFAPLVAGAGRLRISSRHERYLSVLGLVLDALAAADGSVSAAARTLGMTTSNLVDFLQRDEEALGHANKLRAAANLRPLGGR